MSNHETIPTDSTARPPEETPWQRLASSDPIRIREPLAEVLGMVPDGEPLVVTFADVAKTAGHACPAVAGAYRSTQLALEQLFPDKYPVRSDIEVTVGGEPGDPGVGPMANVIRHITGAADESGFAGFGGFGGRENLLTFGTIEVAGRAFRFERTDTGATVLISFDPSSTGVDPDSGGGQPMQALSKTIAGELDEETTNTFLDQWHERVQRILEGTADDGPFRFEHIQ